MIEAVVVELLAFLSETQPRIMAQVPKDIFCK